MLSVWVPGYVVSILQNLIKAAGAGSIFCFFEKKKSRPKKIKKIKKDTLKTQCFFSSKGIIFFFFG